MVLSLWAASPARAGDLSGLEACLVDQTRVVKVFAERFPHEACTQLSACDPKLVTSAEVIATRNCRQEAIGDCAMNEEMQACIHALRDRWSEALLSLIAKNAFRITKLDMESLPPLVSRRLSQSDEVSGENLGRECPTDTTLLEAVLGRADLGMETCEVYATLKALEAAEMTSRYIDGVVAR